MFERAALAEAQAEISFRADCFGPSCSSGRNQARRPAILEVMGRREIHLVNALLIAGLLLFSIWSYQHLPESIPAHFDFDGTPTRWAAKSFWSWFSGPMVGIALAAMMYGIAAVAPRLPNSVNMPDKKRYMKLPIERKLRVLSVTQNLLYATSVPLLTMFMLIQYGSWISAQGGSATPYVVIALIIGVLITPATLIFFLPKSSSVLKRELEEFEKEQPPNATRESER